MGIKRGEFEFPSGFGFSGSAGQTMVKGYARGGKVTKAKPGCACGGQVMKKGGKVKKPSAERLTKPERALLKQAATQLAATGRLPGVPGYNDTPLVGE